MRKALEKTLVVAFFGSGDASAEEVQATLDDFRSVEERPLKFILPVTEDLFGPGLQAVADYAIDQKIDFEVVIDDTVTRSQQRYVDQALKEHSVADVAKKLFALEPNFLAIVWGDEDTVLHSVCSKAVDAELEVRDLTEGLEVVTFDDDEVESEASSGPQESTSGDEVNQDDEWQPYTEEELQAADVEDVRQVARDFGIIISDKARKSTLIPAILKAQEEQADGGSVHESEDISQDVEDEPVEAPESPQEALGESEAPDVLLKALLALEARVEALEDALNHNGKVFSEVQARLDEVVATNAEALATLEATVVENEKAAYKEWSNVKAQIAGILHEKQEAAKATEVPQDEKPPTIPRRRLLAK